MCMILSCNKTKNNRIGRYSISGHECFAIRFFTTCSLFSFLTDYVDGIRLTLVSGTPEFAVTHFAKNFLSHSITPPFYYDEQKQED